MEAKPLKVKEQRIGNLVWEPYGYTSKIERIDEDIFRKRYGIPLTEDWLKRFGFEKIDKKIWLTGDRFTNQIYVRPYFEGGYCWGIYDRICDISDDVDERAELYDCRILRSVHDVQNLIYWMTGQELELKP